MIFCHDDEAIIAQCTPKGSGAIALLRISGINAEQVAIKISKLGSGQSLAQAESHTIHYGWVVDDTGNHIDQVMFFLMRGPKTFTGQDTIEITAHNNQFIIEAIIAQAIAAGARLAKEGEFTKRSVLNGKIDLIQAEAINELIHANTQMALKQSMAQLEGTLSHWLISLEKELIKALAFSEASFEFIDEEMTFDAQIILIIKNALGIIASIKKSFDAQLHIRQGVRIAIIGSVNAGKSSLFNALLNRDRAIVTHIAGTTRDALEAGMYKFDSYITLIDTAGLRQTEDIIEQEGIKRSHQEAQQADLILLVIDGSRIMTAEETKLYDELYATYESKIILVQNKSDLPTVEATWTASKAEIIKASTLNTDNSLELESRIQEKISSLFSNLASPFLLNQRQFNLTLRLEKHLQEIETMLDGKIAYELLSYHLNDALAHVSELTGKTISEKGMDAVFKEFCVGK